MSKDAMVGRWNEQDFIAVVRGAKAAEAAPAQRVMEHLSTPYACMLGGKVVRIPLEVTAEYLAGTAGLSAEQLLARVSEAFA